MIDEPRHACGGSGSAECTPHRTSPFAGAVERAELAYRGALRRLEQDPTLPDVERSTAMLEAAAIAEQELGSSQPGLPNLRSARFECWAWQAMPQLGVSQERGTYWGRLPAAVTTTTATDTLGNLTASEIERRDFYAYLARRLSDSPSPVHRARYADLLWEWDGGYQHALAAVRGYLATVPLMQARAGDQAIRRTEALRRALTLATCIGNGALIDHVKEALFDQLDRDACSTYLPLDVDLLEAPLELPRSWVSSADIQRGRAHAEAAAREFERAGPHRHDLAVRALDLASRYAQAAGDAEAEHRALVEIGAARERRASAVAGLSRLVETRFLEQALQHYRQYRLDGRAHALVPRLRSARRSGVAEAVPLRLLIELDLEEADWLADSLTADLPARSLARFAHTPGHLPSLEQSRRAAQAYLHLDAVEAVPTANTLPTPTHAAGGRQLPANANPDQLEGEVFSLYHLHSQLMGTIIARIFRRMVDRERWTADTMASFIGSAAAFAAGAEPMVRTGIERYIARDYVSALHVLLPQVERAVRRLVQLAGASITQAAKRAEGQPLPIVALDIALQSSVFAGSELRDLVFYLRFLLTDERGLALKAAIDNGLLESDQAQEPLAALVLDALFVLATLRVVPPQVEHWGRIELPPTLDGGAPAGISPRITDTAPLLPQAWVQEITDRIARDFTPLRIVLFGSYARGDAHAGSDIDLLVILPVAGDVLTQTAEIRHTLADVPIALDIVVADPTMLAERCDRPDSVLYAATREGRILYDRAVYGFRGSSVLPSRRALAEHRDE